MGYQYVPRRSDLLLQSNADFTIISQMYKVFELHSDRITIRDKSVTINEDTKVGTQLHINWYKEEASCFLNPCDEDEPYYDIIHYFKTIPDKIDPRRVEPNQSVRPIGITQQTTQKSTSVKIHLVNIEY